METNQEVRRKESRKLSPEHRREEDQSGGKREEEKRDKEEDKGGWREAYKRGIKTNQEREQRN